ncbi:MAG: pilus assembly protein PilP [Paucibacter sp.]|nr:pilus assembly protein PilP [Roseateles sp.]MBV8379922.1 pilus assembly protein PilP [Roseateles sp.]
MPSQKTLRYVSVMALAALMAACTADIDELRGWMEQQRREAHPHVTPLVAPKKFLPEPYAAAQLVDPFSAQKLSVGIRSEAAQPNSLLTAELNRRREPLEAFPLDNMSMVGSMMRKDQRFALLKVDSLLYQVKKGDYLGQNFGKVTAISETDMTLREIVQDAAGEWVERTTTLQLQEKGR